MKSGIIYTPTRRSAYANLVGHFYRLANICANCPEIVRFREGVSNFHQRGKSGLTKFPGISFGFRLWLENVQKTTGNKYRF